MGLLNLEEAHVLVSLSFFDRWNAVFTKPVPNLVLRMAVLVVGLGFIAFGVALSRATGMGTSPISCVPAVLSYAVPGITIGTFTFVFNLVFVAAQVAMLRRDYKPIQLLQLPLTLVFAVLIDLFVPLAERVPLPTYPTCVAAMLVSVCFTAFGVFLEVKATFIPLPGEGISTTVSKVTGIAFPRCKLGFDVGNVVLGAAISLLAMGGLFGVREGTLIAALAVGPLVRVVNRALPQFDRWVPTQAPGLLFADQTVASSKKPAVDGPTTGAALD